MAGTIRRFFRRLRNALGHGRAEADLAREIAAHLAVLEDRYRDSGMTPEEAHFAARRAMGGVEQAKALQRDARSFRWIDDARRDAQHAVKSFGRNRGFGALAILTVGLGVGATTAVYTAFDAAFLRPLPFPHAERLMRLAEVSVPLRLDGFTPRGQAPAAPAAGVPVKMRVELEDLYGLRDVFVHSAAHATGAANLGSGPEPLRVDVTFVTTGFFATLGRDAALGRLFTPEEVTGNGSKVTILADRLWRSHFGADAAIVGRTVTLDAVPYEVIGVMPRDFRFPAQAQLWVPLPVPAPATVMSAFRNFLPAIIVARLADGITPPLAAERLDVIRQQYLRERADSRASTVPVSKLVIPLQRSLLGDRRTALAVLMASAGLVLLIACANTATLLMSRAAARRREMATHAVLGAARGRLVRRLLIESLVLAGAGAIVGLALAFGGVSLLPAVLPPGLAGLAPVQVDLRVLTFALGVTLGTGVLFGLWPAIAASRMTLTDALHESGTRQFTSSGRLNRLLAVTQVAVACLLVIGAALMLTSLRSLLATELGMQIERVATARVNLPPATYPASPERADFVQSTLARLGGAAGIEAAAAINTLPLAQEPGIGLRVDPEGTSRTAIEPADFAPYLVVSPDYFRTMGIPLLRGRDLEWSDSATLPVAVINRTAARRFWPGEDALGRRFTFGSVRTVVGVVEDARISDLATAVGPQVYLPIQEQPQNYMSFVVRSNESVKVGALSPLIRAAVGAVDPALPVYAAQPLEAVIADGLTGRRVNTLLISAFGALALCLAAVGVYGVLACSVAQRTREIGVRMALGGERRTVLALVLRQGMMLVAAGLVLGTIAALAATRYMEEMLYGVTPRDPLTFTVVVLALGIVGLIASFVPAHRAAGADPLTALRNE
jgi:predicted permease